MKINGQNQEMLKAAIEQFGDKSEDEIAFGETHLFFWRVIQNEFFSIDSQITLLHKVNHDLVQFFSTA